MSDIEVKKIGRPAKIDDKIVKKLEESFAIGANDTEACSYAGISRQSYYTYLKKNPKFFDRVQQLKTQLPLKAKKELVNLIEDGNAKAIFWYLDKHEKRDKQAEENNENQMIIEQLMEDELKRLHTIRKYEEHELDRVQEYALCLAQVKVMRARMAQQGETLYSEKTGGLYTNPLYNQLQSVQNRMDRLRDALYPPSKDPSVKVVKDIRDEFI